jgi:hypothetical protein
MVSLAVMSQKNFEKVNKQSPTLKEKIDKMVLSRKNQALSQFAVKDVVTNANQSMINLIRPIGSPIQSLVGSPIQTPKGSIRDDEEPKMNASPF